MSRGNSSVPGTRAAAAGPDKLYAEVLREVAGTLQQRGKQVSVLGGSERRRGALQSLSRSVSQLPPNVIAVPWYYDAEIEFTRMVEPFAKTKIPQVIGTGIWAWDELSRILRSPSIT